MNLNVSVVCKNIDEVDHLLLYLDSIGRTWNSGNPYQLKGNNYEELNWYLAEGSHVLITLSPGSFMEIPNDYELNKYQITFTEFFTPYGKQVTIGSGRVTT